jgi:hypothetical protein
VSLIDDIVCDGARRMPAAALEAEVVAYRRARRQPAKDGRRLVVRNGHATPRQVPTSSGAAGVRAARQRQAR